MQSMPSSSPSTPPRAVWIFQTVRSRYDLSTKLSSRRTDNWMLSRDVDVIKPGDVAYLWQAQQEESLFGWAMVNSGPFEDTDDTENQVAQSAGADAQTAQPPTRRYKVELLYQVAFPNPLTRTQIRQDPRLQNLAVLRTAHGTNFPLRAAEAVALNALIRDQGFTPPPDPIGADIRSILAGYDSDVTDGPDLLGIEDDVNAFASLIAARTVSPPLSIGLFGDWGSGKTFFMQRLRRQVQEIADKARESGKLQKDITFYKRIAQIEFNAWQFAEGNLWASLVEHIFANLRVSRDDGENVIKARQEHLLRQLQREEVALSLKNKEVEDAGQERDNAQAELRRIEQERGEEEQRLVASQEQANLSPANILRLSIVPEDAQRDTVQALEESGLPAVSRGVTDLYDALSDARTVLERGSSVLTPLVRAKDRSRRFWLLVIIVFATPFIGFLISAVVSFLGNQGLAAITGFASGAAVFVTTAGQWLRSQTTWISQRVEAIERAKRRFDEQITAKRAEIAREVSTSQQKLVHLETRYLAERRKAEEQQRRVEQLRAELAETQPTRLLARFIQDRAESKDYRKHLGLLALVRRDFEQLTTFLTTENRSLDSYQNLPDEVRDEELRINRVVLYIDDLDRCPPSVVVKVLQAVHMLLAFQLFVVVVGVDARWVSRSLRTQYPDLLALEDGPGAEEAGLHLGRDATPHDYLEKIFQIPFWIEPMGELGTQGMLQGLLGTSLAAESLEHGTSDDGDGQGPQSGAGKEPPEPPVKHKTLDLHPDRLTIGPAELKFMEHLAPLLGRSPRAVKRFVNVYRLIKMAIPQGEQASFVQEKEPASDFQGVMFLLGIITGMPSLSQPLLTLLLNPPQDTDGRRVQMNNLDELVNRLDVSNSAVQQTERARLRAWLDGYQDGLWKAADLTPLVARAPRVARFSFWGAWSHINSDESLLL
jgi:KAP family P-loop domain/EVE domain